MQPLIAAMLKVRQAFYAAIIQGLIRTKSVLQTILNIWISPIVIKAENGEGEFSNRVRGKMAAQEFLDLVERELRGPMRKSRLVELSDGLKIQFKESMVDSPLNMLPSYNHQLPSGEEHGPYLALDVGGSTFRVALIELSGRKNETHQQSKILRLDSFKISNGVRQLKGILFFDWMAERIGETLCGQMAGHNMSDEPLSMGLSWSFPIE